MNVTVVDHPLVKHKLAILRNVDTGSKQFREIVSELAVFLAIEATRDLETTTEIVTTPICDTECEVVSGKKLAIIPILRAGLGMVDGIIAVIPSARVGHLGMYRDHETHKPVPYYENIPADIAHREVLVIDPMLATGGSAAAAIEYMKGHGARDIKLLVIIAAPEGIEEINRVAPDVQIFTCAVDECLNENAYIVPGLGDAGDRIFGTKV